jgi:hypothetical protein
MRFAFLTEVKVGTRGMGTLVPRAKDPLIAAIANHSWMYRCTTPINQTKRPFEVAGRFVVRSTVVIRFLVKCDKVVTGVVILDSGEA